MQRLQRVFGVEIQTCQRCGGPLKVIASIEDPVLIERILAQLERAAVDEGLAPFASRGPPQLRCSESDSSPCSRTRRNAG
jgi:hypothetical protein